MRPLRILHVFPYYCPPDGSDSGGGTKMSTLTLLQGLDPACYENYVLLPAPSPRYDEPFRQAGARELLYLNDPNHLVLEFARLRSGQYLARYPIRLLAHIVRVRRVIRRYGIDVVHSHTSSFLGAALAAKLSGVPSIVHVREYGYRLSPLLNRAYQRLVVLVADRILCCAEFIEQGFVQAGCPPRRVATVYNGVDLDVFRPGQDPRLRRELGVPEAHRVVGFVGRLAPRKGVEYFLGAAEQVLRHRTDVAFVVVGDNDAPAEQRYKAALFATASRSGPPGAIRFLGARSDMAHVYASLDLLVFCSPQDMGPRVPLEAMAAGVPVVAASRGGAEEEVVDGDTGVRVPPEDTGAIARAILDLLARPERMRAMGVNARHRVERLFSQRQHVRRVADAYLDVAGSRTGRDGSPRRRRRAMIPPGESGVT
jgi:glycosyltransferase involved in cell wall biosynthesis